jgi:hypothetical protein
MHQPETHLDIVRARHSDLLRQARAGELATRLAAGRRAERRSLVERLRRRETTPASPAPASR